MKLRTLLLYKKLTKFARFNDPNMEKEYQDYVQNLDYKMVLVI